MPTAARIAKEAGVPIVLRPIRIIEANGGIPLRSRPTARQAYHAVELERWRERLSMPLNLEPKFYPCRTIEIAAQCVISAQRSGLDAVGFSFAVQRALWAEERDIADVATLKEVAKATIGAAGAALVTENHPPEISEEWRNNLKEAEAIGIFGTPTYVVGRELFWGQDRLDFVAAEIAKTQAGRVAA